MRSTSAGGKLSKLRPNFYRTNVSGKRDCNQGRLKRLKGTKTGVVMLSFTHDRTLVPRPRALRAPTRTYGVTLCNTLQPSSEGAPASSCLQHHPVLLPTASA